MNALENVFRSLYCKADGSLPAHVPAAVCMHTSALSAWTLLLSTLPTSVLQQLLEKYVWPHSIFAFNSFLFYPFRMLTLWFGRQEGN